MKPPHTNASDVKPQVLKPLMQNCLGCHQRMTLAYNNQRTLATLRGTLPLRLKIYWCTNEKCHLFHRRYRPESEGRLAVPRCQFGLDVILAVGETARKSPLPKRPKTRIADISAVHAMLEKHGITISIREIRNLRHRYECLLQHSPTNDAKTLEAIRQAGYSILDMFEVSANGGWTPLWIIRDWCTGGLLATINVNRGGKQKLFSMIGKVRDQLGVPVLGLVSDGHPIIRSVIAKRFRLLSMYPHLRSLYVEISPNDDSQALEEVNRLQQTIRERHTQFVNYDPNSNPNLRFAACSPLGESGLFTVTWHSTALDLNPLDLCRPTVWRNNRKG